MNQDPPLSELAVLRRDAERLAKLIEVCPNSVVYCHGDRIVQVNSSLAQLLKYPSPQSLCGRSLDSLIAADRRHQTVSTLNSMLQVGVGQHATVSARLLRSDDAEVEVVASVEGLEHDEQCDRVIVFRLPMILYGCKAASREQLAQVSHLQRMAAFGELAASLMHELGQPLTAANGACELLQNHLATGPASPETTRCSVILAASVSQATRQLERLWAFVQQRKPASQATDLNAVTERVLDMVRASARHAGVNIQLKTSDVSAVWTDPDWVESVMVSLLSRSILTLTSGFGGERQIEITIHQPTDDRVEWIIAHSPPGLSDEMTTAGADTPSTSSAAQHFGLSICRTIIEACGGVLSIQPPRESKSWRYRLVFPVTETASAG